MLLLLWSLQCIASQNNYDPILVAVIMVKNEETVMEKTLQPFVDGGVNSFLVLDTGSTDNTIEVTHNFFEKNNVTQGYIVQEDFIDFAASRNKALKLAQEKFPNAAFMIMLDAEWYLNDAKKLVDFCKECLENTENYPSYLIRILNTALDFYTGRLIKCNCDVWFEGAVHEAINKQSPLKVPADIYFEYLPEKIGIEKTNARLFRDRDILFREYHKNPTSSRTLFYLARTCEDLGDLEMAYFLYQKRIQLNGWDEENFMSYYRLAQTVEKLSYINEKYTWDEALLYYLKSFEMRPTRAEPLVSIAHYYLHQNNMHLALLYIRRAVDIPYPTNDLLFVQKNVYDYYRYEIMSRCAWYCNEFVIGEWAALEAAIARPDLEHLQNNLECYLSRKKALTA